MRIAIHEGKGMGTCLTAKMKDVKTAELDTYIYHVHGDSGNQIPQMMIGYLYLKYR